jgi:hypothetical protein
VERKVAMKTTKLVLVLLTAGIVLSGGCVSRAIKEGVSVATGPKGFYAEDPSMGAESSRPLGKYESIEIGQFGSDFRSTPGSLTGMIATQLREKLTDAGFPINAPGPTLVVQGTVIYYEKAGLSGQLFGPFEETVCDVQLIDKSTGQKVGNAICIGRSTTTAMQGMDKKAEGVAKGIVEWLKDRYPKAKLEAMKKTK